MFGLLAPESFCRQQPGLFRMQADSASIIRYATYRHSLLRSLNPPDCLILMRSL